MFHLEGGIPVFNGRLDKIESEQAEAKKRDERYKDEQLKVNRRLMWFTGALFLCSAVTGGITAIQAHVAGVSSQAAKSAAETASHQFELTQKQVIGSMRAVITMTSPQLNPTRPSQVILALSNQGHVISDSVHLNFWITKTDKDGKRELARTKQDYFDVGSLDPGVNDWQKKYPLGSEPSRIHKTADNTFKIAGTIGYDDGFGKWREQPFCFVYIGKYRANYYPWGDIETEGDGFLPCGDFIDKVEFLNSGHEVEID